MSFFPLLLGRKNGRDSSVSRARGGKDAEMGIAKSQNSGRARCVVNDVRDGISPVGKICILCEDRLTGCEDWAEPGSGKAKVGTVPGDPLLVCEWIAQKWEGRFTWERTPVRYRRPER